LPCATCASYQPGIRAVELAADLLQAVEARDAFVVAQAARIVVVDVRERRHAGLRLEHLVDLLLVLDDRVRDLGVVQHVHEVGGGASWYIGTAIRPRLAPRASTNTGAAGCRR
jgi:hypothetical protein